MVAMSYIINPEECTRCDTCVDECPMEAIIEDGKGKYIIISDLCTDCGSCADVCPEEAIRGV
jgi:NAD-dependent dihydropyrimidine dehydrogenase PreA subunit